MDILRIDELSKEIIKQREETEKEIARIKKETTWLIDKLEKELQEKERISKDLAMERIKYQLFQKKSVFIRKPDRYVGENNWCVITGFHEEHFLGEEETFFHIQKITPHVNYGEYTAHSYSWSTHHIALNPIDYELSTDEKIWEEIEDLKEQYLG